MTTAKSVCSARAPWVSTCRPHLKNYTQYWSELQRRCIEGSHAFNRRVVFSLYKMRLFKRKISDLGLHQIIFGGGGGLKGCEYGEIF